MRFNLSDNSLYFHPARFPGVKSTNRSPAVAECRASREFENKDLKLVFDTHRGHLTPSARRVVKK